MNMCIARDVARALGVPITACGHPYMKTEMDARCFAELLATEHKIYDAYIVERQLSYRDMCCPRPRLNTVYENLEAYNKPQFKHFVIV